MFYYSIKLFNPDQQTHISTVVALVIFQRENVQVVAIGEARKGELTIYGCNDFENFGRSAGGDDNCFNA